MLSFSNFFANIAFALGLYIFDKIAQNNKKKAKKTCVCQKKFVTLHAVLWLILESRQERCAWRRYETCDWCHQHDNF